MPNCFDPYREALVVEELTIWPDEYESWDAQARQEVEQALHARPQEAAELDYVRMHTGFTRQITVTGNDLSRLGKA
jgi:hypothetical protein